MIDHWMMETWLKSNLIYHVLLQYQRERNSHFQIQSESLHLSRFAFFIRMDLGVLRVLRIFIWYYCLAFSCSSGHLHNSSCKFERKLSTILLNKESLSSDLVFYSNGSEMFFCSPLPTTHATIPPYPALPGYI